MCLRNPDRVPTTFASIDAIQLDQKSKETLFEPRFVIRPDVRPYLKLCCNRAIVCLLTTTGQFTAENPSEQGTTGPIAG